MTASQPLSPRDHPADDTAADTPTDDQQQGGHEEIDWSDEDEAAASRAWARIRAERQAARAQQRPAPAQEQE